MLSVRGHCPLLVQTSWKIEKELLDAKRHQYLFGFSGFVSSKLLLTKKVQQEIYGENFISKWYKISTPIQHTHALIPIVHRKEQYKQYKSYFIMKVLNLQITVVGGFNFFILEH